VLVTLRQDIVPLLVQVGETLHQVVNLRWRVVDQTPLRDIDPQLVVVNAIYPVTIGQQLPVVMVTQQERMELQ
jgi:hypothetical protein